MTTSSTNINESGNPLDEKIFHLIKTSLSNKEGQSYIEFKKGLRPIFKKVGIDITKGWISLIVILLSGAYIIKYTEPFATKIIVAFFTALIIGYIIAYLTNFFHEAAHYNLAADKKKNDFLANIFIGILLGQSIKYYRIIHWEHHKNLGTPGDTETSYFESLNLKLILGSLTGIRVLKILLQRNNFIVLDRKGYTAEIKKEARAQLIAGIILHLSVLSLMVYLQQWYLIISWIAAFGCFYPLFNSLRQLLEHRSETASKNTRYKTTVHGKHNRLFSNSVFDRSFGSAGFNKHLLHHLEPMISYTRIDELENFLNETMLAKHLQIKKTSYFKIFLKLFNK